MGKPTVTLAELRRMVCMEFRMEFYKLFNGSSALTGGTSAIPVDTKLVQSTDYWNSAWFLGTSGCNVGAVRRLFDFSSGSMVLDRALSYTPQVGDTYELLGVFSPNEIHQAINRAIQDGYPAFFDTVYLKEVVICKDKITYDLTSLSKRPWLIYQAYLEPNINSRQGIATGATSLTLVDSSANFSDVTSSWKISIYDGKGAGQLRSISSVSGTTLNISSAWTTTPDTTSYYCIWNPLEEMTDWYRLSYLRSDAKEYPSEMYLDRRFMSNYGLRIGLLCSVMADTLVNETDTTVVPKEYIVYQAAAYMAEAAIGDNRSDRQRFTTMEALFSQRAQTYRQLKQFRHPPTIRWAEDPNNNSGYLSTENPLGWSE